MIIRKVRQNDGLKILELYKDVSKQYPGNLTQYEDELTLEYIQNNVISNALKFGLMLVIEENNKIVGSLKAFTSPYRCLAHTLTNATMMVHPDHHHKQYGAKLMQAFLKKIESELLHIYRFELLPHQSNERAIEFYKKNGFTIETRLKDRIVNIQGQMEDEVILTWFNKKFSSDSLNGYYKYLNNLR